MITTEISLLSHFCVPSRPLHGSSVARTPCPPCWLTFQHASERGSASSAWPLIFSHCSSTSSVPDCGLYVKAHTVYLWMCLFVNVGTGPPGIAAMHLYIMCGPARKYRWIYMIAVITSMSYFCGSAFKHLVIPWLLQLQRNINLTICLLLKLLNWTALYWEGGRILEIHFNIVIFVAEQIVFDCINLCT